MYCRYCGKQIADNAVICINCGSATDNMKQYQQPQQAPAAPQIPQNLTIVNTNTNANAGGTPRPVIAYDYRSRWAAFFLCLFFGWLGVHRFYIRKPVSGIIWMLTVGLFGFGWFIDLIILLFDGFSDGNGAPLV